MALLPCAAYRWRMRGWPVVALTLVSSAAAAQQLPFTGIFGTPAACEAYVLGGKEAVLSGGLDKDGNELPIGDIGEDDAFVLIEPSGITTSDLTCTPVAMDGTRVTFDCSDGEPLAAGVIVRANDTIVIDDGEDPIYLQRCR